MECLLSALSVEKSAWSVFGGLQIVVARFVVRFVVSVLDTGLSDEWFECRLRFRNSAESRGKHEPQEQSNGNQLNYRVEAHLERIMPPTASYKVPTSIHHHSDRKGATHDDRDDQRQFHSADVDGVLASNWRVAPRAIKSEAIQDERSHREDVQYVEELALH